MTVGRVVRMRATFVVGYPALDVEGKSGLGKIATIDEYLESLSEPLREIGMQLRALIDEAFPNATGKVWHGHPVWMSGKNPVAGFKAYTSYVTYMIWRGQEHSDTAVPRDMASTKLHAVADIEQVQAADWLRGPEPVPAT